MFLARPFRQIPEIRDTETSRCRRAKVWRLRISIAFETAREEKWAESTEMLNDAVSSGEWLFHLMISTS